MNVMAVLATLPIFWPILQIVTYFVGKEDSLVKFYSIQTILFGVVAFVISGIGFAIMFGLGMLVLVIGDIAGLLAMLFGLVMMLYGLIVALLMLFQIFKAFKGDVWKMPLVGNFSAKKAGL